MSDPAALDRQRQQLVASCSSRTQPQNRHEVNKLLGTQLHVPHSSFGAGHKSAPTGHTPAPTKVGAVPIGNVFHPIDTLNRPARASKPSTSSSRPSSTSFGGVGFQATPLPPGIHNPAQNAPSVGFKNPSATRSGTQRALNVLNTAPQSAHRSHTGSAGPPPLSTQISQIPRTRTSTAVEQEDGDDDDITCVGETRPDAHPPHKRPRVDQRDARSEVRTLEVIQNVPIYVGTRLLGKGSLRVTKRGIAFSFGSTTFPMGGTLKQTQFFEQPTQTLLAFKFQGAQLPDELSVTTASYEPGSPLPATAFIRCILPGHLSPTMSEMLVASGRLHKMSKDELQSNHYDVVKDAMNGGPGRTLPHLANSSHSIPTNTFYGGQSTPSYVHPVQPANPYHISSAGRRHPPPRQQHSDLSHPATKVLAPRPPPPKKEVFNLNSDEDDMDVDPVTAPAAGSRSTRATAAKRQQQLSVDDLAPASAAVRRAQLQAAAGQMEPTGPVYLDSDDDADADRKKRSAGAPRRERPPRRPAARSTTTPAEESPQAMIETYMLDNGAVGATELFTYPFSGLNAITISPQDAVRLEHWEYLNDNLIEWYFRVLLQETCKNRADEVHIFNTHFYTRLKKAVEAEPKKGAAGESGGEPAVNQDFERVLRHCKNVDLFTKRLVIVPINENLHWYLAVIVNPGKLLEDPPALSTAAAPDEQATPEGVTSSVPGADQPAQQGVADTGIVGMDTTSSSVGDEPSGNGQMSTVTSMAADNDTESAGDASASGSVTPRAQSPPKYGYATDVDSPTRSGFGSEIPPSPRLADDLDGDLDMPASDSSMCTKPGRWEFDEAPAESERDEDPSTLATGHDRQAQVDADAMQVDYDAGGSTSPKLVPAQVSSPKAASKVSGAVQGESTEDDNEPMSLSSDEDEDVASAAKESPYFKRPVTYNARSRPSTSMQRPSNIPRAATQLSAPVAPPAPQHEPKPPSPAASGAAKPTTAAATASSKSSTTSKDRQYDPNNDVLIVVLDSLNSARQQPANNLEKYLRKLAVKRGYKVRSNPPIHRPKPKSPRQPNSCDCGVYLLHYVERLLLDPDRMIQHYARIPGVDSVALWKEEEIPNKRVAMAHMVINYAMLYKQEVTSKRPKQDTAAHESDHDDIQEVVTSEPSTPALGLARTTGGRRLGTRPGSVFERIRPPPATHDAEPAAGHQEHVSYQQEHLAQVQEGVQQYKRPENSTLPPLPHESAKERVPKPELPPSSSTLSTPEYTTRDRFATLNQPPVPTQQPARREQELHYVYDSDDNDDAHPSGGLPTVAAHSGFDDGDADLGSGTPPSRKVARFSIGKTIGTRSPQPALAAPGLGSFEPHNYGYSQSHHFSDHGGDDQVEVHVDVENDDEMETEEDLHIGNIAASQFDKAAEDISDDFIMSAKFSQPQRSLPGFQRQHYDAAMGTSAHGPPPSPGPPPSAQHPPFTTSSRHGRVMDPGPLDGSNSTAEETDDDHELDGGQDWVIHGSTNDSMPDPFATVAAGSVTQAPHSHMAPEPMQIDQNEHAHLSRTPPPKPGPSATITISDDDEGGEDELAHPSTADCHLVTKTGSLAGGHQSAPSVKPTTGKSRPTRPTRRAAKASNSAGNASRSPSSSPVQVARQSAAAEPPVPKPTTQQVVMVDSSEEDETAKRPKQAKRGGAARGRKDKDAPSTPPKTAMRGRGSNVYAETQAESRPELRRSSRNTGGSEIAKRLSKGRT